ncbi:ABC transporter permease [Leucobacter sp. M11]|uniref:ABC transporter permease n=1 Tax=Leucobacter sp. M11 TaxID=2993565 RepID=UPI002D7E7164|nr:ABC transporter permease [Leucobacter sp. M11]MEB4615496.1 ABC transporter permease [Leucobacter sp. M11]
MNRTSYLWKRTAFAIITIFVAVSLNFVLFRILPGSAVTRISRVPNASPELKASLEAQFGLDKSLWEQYWLYLKGLLSGNLGVSYANRLPVADNLGTAFANTLPLVLTGTVIAILLGILIGVVAAVRRGGAFDHISTNVSVLFYAFPTQFLGMMLLIFFAGVLPSAGTSDPFALALTPWEQFLDRGRHLVLPVTTLVLTLFAENVLIMRSSVLETLGEDYILTAKAKGLPRGRIVRSYAVRNAMLPTITMIALALGTVVGGAILIEVIYSWPGIGRALYEAVLKRDYPMLQGGFLVITVVVVVLNYLADLIYFTLDPRVTD